MVVITPLLMMQALQIGSQFASEVVDDPKLKHRLGMLSLGIGAGTSLGELTGAFKAPSTDNGLKIKKGSDVGPKAPKGDPGRGVPKGGSGGVPKGGLGGVLKGNIGGMSGSGILGGATMNAGSTAVDSLFDPFKLLEDD